MWGEFQSYWSMTGTYESILPLINMDFDGLKTAVINMISGGMAEIEVNTYQNDMVTFENMNDVLTLLIHLGYLAYDKSRKMAFIPNEEIRSEFVTAVKKKEWNELVELQRQIRRSARSRRKSIQKLWSIIQEKFCWLESIIVRKRPVISV